MFISGLQLRRIGFGIGVTLGVLLLLFTWLDIEQRSATPVWLEIVPGPPLTYVDGHEDGPRLNAGAAILIEANTGTVLYAHNEHDPRPMASTTKIMTALVALETTPLDESVTVGAEATRVRGSNAGLRVGQQLTMQELLYALLLPSGNDAANVIAEHVGGSQSGFIELMNAKAALLGASATRFANPHGLDAPNHHASAHDMAIIAATAMRYPTFRRIVDSTEFSSPSLGNSWRNTNRLLWGYDDIEGIKTGYTGGAGLCLVAAASRSGMELITVVLAGPDRWQDSLELLEYGFDEFHLITLASHGDVLAEVKVPGAAGTLRAVVDGDFRLVVRDEDVNELNVRVVLEETKAPLHGGQPVGHVIVSGRNDKVLQRGLLVAKDPVKKLGPLGRLGQWIRGVFAGE